MIRSNQERVDRIVRALKCLHQRKGEFLAYIGFEDSVRVDRSLMMREGIPNSMAIMLKTTKGKSDVDRLRGWEIDWGRRSEADVM